MNEIELDMIITDTRTNKKYIVCKSEEFIKVLEHVED